MSQQVPPLASQGALTCSAFLGEITYRIVYCDGARVIVRVSDGTVSPGGVPQSGSILSDYYFTCTVLTMARVGSMSGLRGSVDICGSNPDIVSGHDSHDSCGSVWIVVDLRRRSWFPSCTTYIQAREGENIT